MRILILFILLTSSAWGYRLPYSKHNNPWDEEIHIVSAIPTAQSILEATLEYRGIKFDGYRGSIVDGLNYFKYRTGKNLNLRRMVCIDLILHAVTKAGYHIRKEMRDVLLKGKYPKTPHWYRNTKRLYKYFKKRQLIFIDKLTDKQSRDPNFKPKNKFKPGDILFLGHRNKPYSKYLVKHVGIVRAVTKHGMVKSVYNIRVVNNPYRSFSMLWAPKEGLSKKFAIVAHGRIVK